MNRSLNRSLLLIYVMLAACSSRAPTVGLPLKYEWRVHHDAAKAAYARGDRQTAEREIRRALDVAAQEPSPSLATAISLNALSVLYIDDGRSNDAAPMLDKATEIFEARGETDDEFFATLLTNRGQLAISQGRAADAEREYRRALGIGAVPDAVHERALRGAVASLCLQGRTEEAAKLGAGLSIACQKDRGSNSETSNSTAAPDGGREAIRNGAQTSGSAAAGEQLR
jgi:tetratricopeptide (TPR) repeat protein